MGSHELDRANCDEPVWLNEWIKSEMESYPNVRYGDDLCLICRIFFNKLSRLLYVVIQWDLVHNFAPPRMTIDPIGR